MLFEETTLAPQHIMPIYLSAIPNPNPLKLKLYFSLSVVRVKKKQLSLLPNVPTF